MTPGSSDRFDEDFDDSRDEPNIAGDWRIDEDDPVGMELPVLPTAEEELVESVRPSDGEDDYWGGDDHLDQPGEQDRILEQFLAVEKELDSRWGETQIEPSLDRITALLELLGDPHRAYPVIHVAGTNGKSSTVRMIDALLGASEQRVGRATSPHLQVATERIAIDGKPISMQAYVQAWQDVEPFVGLVDEKSVAAGGPRMSKFEVLTAMTFAAFADAPVDVAVIETGLGGTWDATNVVHADVCVITPIGIDHTEYLGDTIELIAGEKAGIIGGGDSDEGEREQIVVVGPQAPQALEVIERAAAHSGAMIARQGTEFDVVSSITAVGGRQVHLQGLGGHYEEVFLPVHGKHQADNASLALAAVEAFFGAGKNRALDSELVCRGFNSLTLPGRLEVVASSPTMLVDAAHNPHGASALADAISTEFAFERVILVLSVFEDKDVAGVVAALVPGADEVVVTHNGSPRAMPVPQLTELVLQHASSQSVHSAATLPAALQLAHDLVGQNVGTGIIVTGSVVSAGNARSLQGKEPA